MILLDTHAWVWAAIQPGGLSPAAAHAIADADRLAVSAISCWEIASLLRRGRLDSEGLEISDWIQRAVAADPRLVTIPIDRTIATLAGSFGDDLHGDPADRLIIATAITLGVDVVTKDKKIRAFPRLRTIW